MISRRKKVMIIAIVGVIITLASLWIVIQAYENPVDYWMEQKDEFAKGLGWLTVYCKNGGGADVDFYLVLKLENVTISNQTSKLLFSTVSVMEFRFVLHKDEADQKTVYFLTNQTESMFGLSLSLEKINFWDMVIGNGLHPTSLVYQWNQQQESYVLVPQIHNVMQ